MLKKAILITGANGEIGQALIKALNKKNIHNIVTIDLHPIDENYSIYEHFEGSILDLDLLISIQEKYILSEIYHLAAILSTKAEKNIQLANEVNIKGTKNVLELAKKHVKINNLSIPFFFPSSIAVYKINNNNEIAFHENMVEELPLTAYGIAKLECEKMGVQYKKNSINKIDFRCIRFPGIISASSTPTGGTSDYVPEMIHCAAKNLQYHCFVNKNSQLPFIVMPDAINAIFDLMNADEKKINHCIYNISSFSHTAHQFYTKIKEYYPQFEISYDIDIRRQEIVDSWPNYINDNNATIDWGWDPIYNFENAFEKYIIPEIQNIIEDINE